MFWRWCSITMRCLAVGVIAFLTVTTAWAAGGGHGGGGHGGAGFGGSGHSGFGRGFGGFGYGAYGYGRGFGGFGYGAYGYGRGFYGGYYPYGYGFGYGRGFGGFGYGGYGGYPYGYGFGGYGRGLYGYGYGLGYGTGFYGYETAPAYGYSGDTSNYVGYSSSGVSDYYYSPSAFAAISPASDLPDTAVVLDVRVPANAEIWVNGVKMHLTGASREFVSPPLTPGKVGTYDLRARWEEDGQQVERTRRVTVRAGDRLSINFINPS